MSDVLNRLRKKRGSPINIDGETFYVRSLTIGELTQLDTINADERTGYVVGCALVNEDGSQVIPKADSESSIDYAKRVLQELDDVPTANIKAISDGVANLGKSVKPEAVLKN